MKLYLIITLSIISSIFAYSQDADSIIVTNDSIIAVKIYTNDSLREYRTYDDLGFYCFSFYEDIKSGKFLAREDYGGNLQLLQIRNDIDFHKDVVFLSDNFEMGFARSIKLCEKKQFDEKFYITVRHYYSSSSNISAYVKKMVDDINSSNNLLFISEDKFPVMGLAFIVKMEKDWYDGFCEEFDKKIHFSQKKRKELENMLVFQVTFKSRTGLLTNIELVSDVSPKAKEKIQAVLSKVDKHIITPIYPNKEYVKEKEYKAAVYIELKK